MNERFQKWTAWIACAALIMICGTSVAFAAPANPIQQGPQASQANVTPREEGQGSSVSNPSTPSTEPPSTSSTPDPPGSSSQDPVPPEGNTQEENQPDTPASPTESNTGGHGTTQGPDSPPANTNTQSTANNRNPSPTTSNRRPSGNAVSVSSSEAESSSEVSSKESSSEEPSSTISLPDVDSMDLSVPQMLGSGVEESTQNNTLLGILAWVLIGVGILIVLIVLFTSAKSGGKKSIGRKRYHRGTYKSKRKHLLDDKYYRKNKYK